MVNDMHYGAAPILFERARILRERMTFAKKLLWFQLQKKKTGFRFKAQHPIDIFIADFYCHELKLIIEVDGNFHANQKEQDQSRSDELNDYGIQVIRFTNEEVINQMEFVMIKIEEQFKQRKQ
jgi:very-short-patch-repair endonuclease